VARNRRLERRGVVHVGNYRRDTFEAVEALPIAGDRRDLVAPRERLGDDRAAQPAGRSYHRDPHAAILTAPPTRTVWRQ
jgi:hypothetical protein